MKINKCRSCKSTKIKKTFDLGNQYLTGVFPSKKNDKVSKGNLALVICEKCGLLQLEDSFDSHEMYGSNYGYRSSLNKSMFDHLKNKSRNLIKKYNLKSGDTIIDTGSNDGTFLSFFGKNFNSIGVDPTIVKFKNFYKKNIIKVSDFFSYQAVKKHLKKKAKLITSIAMFYDLEDPISFVEDVYECLDDNGIWHLEQSYMPSMIKNISYDTICHEHIEYYSLRSLKFILDAVGFKIINIELNNINGGSFAVTAAKKKSKHEEHKKIINWLLKKEEIANYNKVEIIKEFGVKATQQKVLLRDLLNNLADMGKTVYGYGASTKGNVILQYCNINQKNLPFVCDVNPFKFNKYTPGTKIKIISEAKAKKVNPDYFLVLPWHFRDFIIKKEKKYLNSGKNLIFPLPDIEII